MTRLPASRRGSRPVPLAARTLIDVPNWVGDQLMAMPAVARLLASGLVGEPVLLVPAPTRRLFEAVFPGVPVEVGRRRSSPLAEARRVCRGTRFDVGVTFRHASRAKILVRAAARLAVGSEGRGGRVLLDVTYPVDRRRHQLLDAEPLLERLDAGRLDPGWRLSLPSELLDTGRRRLAAVVADEVPVIGLAPATGCGEAKRWPAARFGDLVRCLGDVVACWVVVVGPGEGEIAEELCAAAGRPLPVLGADADVAGLASLLAHLDLLVCNDSGPMHLAAFQGVPVVALFGPTDPARTGPVGDGHGLITSTAGCAPCRRPSCPLGVRVCLDDLTIEAVAAAVTGRVPSAVTVGDVGAVACTPRAPGPVVVSRWTRSDVGGAAPAVASPAPPARAAGRHG